MCLKYYLARETKERCYQVALWDFIVEITSRARRRNMVISGSSSVGVSFSDLFVTSSSNVKILTCVCLPQLKNRTKKQCQKWWTSPPQSEQPKTRPPPPPLPPWFLPPQPSLLSPTTVFNWVYTAAHSLSTFSSFSTHLSHLLPVCTSSPSSLRTRSGLHFLSQGLNLYFFFSLWMTPFFLASLYPLRFMSSLLLRFLFLLYFALSSVAKYACLYL